MVAWHNIPSYKLYAVAEIIILVVYICLYSKSSTKLAVRTYFSEMGK